MNTLGLLFIIANVKSSGESLLELLGVIVIFIIVLVCCWATTKFVASRQIKQRNMGNFEVIETYAIAKDRYLQLVRIGKKYYATSVCKDSINMLTEVPEEDVKIVSQGTGYSVTGFADILKRFSSIKNGNELEAASEESKDNTDNSDIE